MLGYNCFREREKSRDALWTEPRRLSKSANELRRLYPYRLRQLIFHKGKKEVATRSERAVTGIKIEAKINFSSRLNFKNPIGRSQAFRYPNQVFIRQIEYDMAIFGFPHTNDQLEQRLFSNMRNIFVLQHLTSHSKSQLHFPTNKDRVLGFCVGALWVGWRGKGRRIILHFEAVDSAFYAWVNGDPVGYSVAINQQVSTLGIVPPSKRFENRATHITYKVLLEESKLIQ
ncbi:hypothetical protein RND71_035484 [Anisodus tanguticus]|uniref:Uncharacterized protein n=1 Tax=Anisodus tanguticus TaxID=243964 RepID=A0AAE1UUI0_9SOLA|nr:hypothetical protein RND71_035484 [Anisodus tanguticus]